jgi:hypothetical protein
VHSAIANNFDLSSDHSAILITLSADLIWKTPPPKLFTAKTNWKEFQLHIYRNINLTLSLQTPTENEDAVDYANNLIQEAAWTTTPPRQNITPVKHNIPLQIKKLMAEKLRARSRWQRSRNPHDKTILNRLTHRLTNTLKENRNVTFQYNISTLSKDDHTIWKANKKINRPILPVPPIIKQDVSSTRSNEEKANTFAHHLARLFMSLPSRNQIFDSVVEEYLDTPGQLSLPLDYSHQQKYGEKYT